MLEEKVAGIVRAAQEGDNDAFAELYHRFFNRVYRYIVARVGNREDAEDLTEEVFLKILESLPSFQWRGVPFSSWIFRIAHNLVVDHLRRRERRREVPMDWAPSSPAPDPEYQALEHLAYEEVSKALEQLTELQREVIALRFGGGLSVAETAQVMGKNGGAIKALQHSAIQALRRILEDHHEK